MIASPAAPTSSWAKIPPELVSKPTSGIGNVGDRNVILELVARIDVCKDRLTDVLFKTEDAEETSDSSVGEYPRRNGLSAIDDRFCGFGRLGGGRTRARTWDPMIKSLRPHIDWKRLFSQPERKAPMLRQYVTSNFPTAEPARSAPRKASTALLDRVLNLIVFRLLPFLIYKSKTLNVSVKL